MPQILYNSAFDAQNHPKNVNDFFEHFINQEKPENAILILPTNKLVDWTKKQFIQKYFAAKKLPSPELKFYNLQDFAKVCLNFLAKNANKKYQFLSNAAILTIMEEAANACQLQYFAKNRKISITILQKLMTIILGLKEDGILPENMENELKIEQNIASARLRFDDLTKIYQKYEELLETKYENFLDEPAIFSTVQKLNDTVTKNNEKFTKIDKNLQKTATVFALDEIFCENSVIMFSGFSEFKLPEAKFVAQFSHSKIPTIVNIDYSQIEGPNIESLPQNVRRLVVSELNQKSIGLKKLEKNPQNLKPSEHIRKWIFNENQSLFNEKLIKQIKIFEANDKISEVKNLANLVRFLNFEKKIPFSEMCICTRNPEKYSDLFREFFSESGLVVNISDRFLLVNSAPIVLIFSLLEIVANNWRRNDIERIIFSPEILKEIPNIPILLTVAKKYRISGGSKTNWKKSLEKYLDFSKNNFEKISNKNIENFEKDDLNFAKKNIEELENSILIIDKLEKILNFKNQKYNFSEFSKLIKNQIITKLKIAENIFLQYEKSYFKNQNHNLEEFQILEEIEKNGKSLAKFIEILDELEKIETEKNQNEKYEFSELIEKLKTASSGEKYQLNEKKSLGINITSIEQTRGIPYSVMILCGAIDTEFPLKFQTDKFLGKELNHSERLHNDNERILFYQFLTNNVELLDSEKMRIFITFPQNDEQKKNIRSPFIDDLCKITHNDEVAKFVKNIDEIKNNFQNFDDFYLKKNELEWINYITQPIDIYSFIAKNKKFENLLTEKYKNNYKRVIENYKSKKSEKLLENEEKNGIYSNNLTEFAKNFLTVDLPNKIYSVSQLENYAQCPFKFFVQNILQINKINEVFLDDEFNPIENGNFLHKILEKFYKENLEKSNNFVENFKIFDVTVENEAQKQKYLHELIEIADNLIGKFDFPLFKYEKEKIVGETGILETWLNNEIAKNSENKGFHSIFFEYKFGYKNENLSKNYVTLQNKNGDKIKIRGKIDRIELMNKNAENYFRIADYKSSYSSVIGKKREIEDGKSLQIPIYLLAIEQIFAENKFIPHSGLYYILAVAKNKSNKYENEIITKENQEYFENILENSCNFAIEYKNKINKLMFAPTQNKKCNFCDYKRLCKNY